MKNHKLSKNVCLAKVRSVDHDVANKPYVLLLLLSLLKQIIGMC
jgi:hypothetical protein